MVGTGYSNTGAGGPVTSKGMRGLVRTHDKCRNVFIRSIQSKGLWESMIGCFSSASHKNSLLDDVSLRSHWSVCVNDSGSDISKLAKVFDFPQSPFVPGHLPSTTWPKHTIESCEATQIVGITYLDDEQIMDRMNTLDELWGTAHAFLMNSQHFAILLARLITSPKGSPNNDKRVLDNLWFKLAEARGEFQNTRQIACVVGIFILPPVALAVAGGSMFFDERAENGAKDVIRDMLKEFPKLKSFANLEALSGAPK